MKAYVLIWEDIYYTESKTEIMSAYNSKKKAIQELKKRQDEGEPNNWRVEVYDLKTGKYLEDL